MIVDFLVPLFFVMAAGTDLGTTMKGILVSEPGGPEVLQLVDVDIPTPGAGEVLIRVHASAVNRADTLQRKGLYPPPPGASSVLGLEFVGEVVSDGQTWHAGDRVMTIVGGGGNAEYVVAHEETLLPVPEGLSW
jgi:NADPH2:quinone reductase